VAIQTALTYPHRLAGLLGLSTYFATHDRVRPDPVNRDMPVKLCHGTADPVVPERIGRDGCERLREMGYGADYKTYPMEHAVCMEEIADVSSWFRTILGSP
jgi:phospholipase/carboxylesterase